MTNDARSESDPEMPSGMKRKHLRIHDSVRQYLRDQTEDTEVTMSQELNSYLPDDWEDIEFGYGGDDICHLKITPELKGRIVSMAGQNISQGDVVTLFVLLAALENGDLEPAEDIAFQVPELIWTLLSDLSTIYREGVDGE